MSARIAPPGDISLPKAEEPDASDSANKTLTPPLPSLSFRHYSTFVISTILAASGMVHAEYIFVVIFSFIYLHFISKIAFPPVSLDPPPLVYGRNNKTLGLYVSAAGVIGLLLPIAYILEGVIDGNEAVKAAAPHLFLLASQVFMEGVSYVGCYSLPVRVFVPVFYNSVRITSIWKWVTSEFSEGTVDGFAGSYRRMYVGKSLAVANMALWSFNLFGFLLPFYLPKAFKIYYSKVKD